MHAASTLTSALVSTESASYKRVITVVALQEERKEILELREYAKEANMGKAAMNVRRVEKIYGDLLRKLPKKFKVSP